MAAAEPRNGLNEEQWRWIWAGVALEAREPDLSAFQVHTLAEELLDVGSTQPIEIVGTEMCPSRNPLCLTCVGSAHGDDFDQRFARLRNDERLTHRCLIHQLEEMGFAS